MLRQIMNDAGCAMVIAIGGSCPTPPDLPFIGPFRYLRFHHGSHGIGFSGDELVFWMKRLHRDITEGRDIYIYFNNDAEGYAIRDAVSFRELVEKVTGAHLQSPP